MSSLFRCATANTGRGFRASRALRWMVGVALVVAVAASAWPAPAMSLADEPNPPAETIKLVFVHHSTGENWLADDNGGLGIALGANNYFVSDTNYGWGPDGIGDRTDIVNWPEWFTGPNSSDILAALYAESGQNSSYTRTLADPGGENQVVMIKSCFPNSQIEGSPDDPPQAGEGLTVGNAKAIYQEILTYFATRPDKLFVVVTAPPVQDKSLAANARAFNNWLMTDWLAGYQGNNVAVFDFYTVLTDRDNHHRFVDGQIEWVTDQGGNTSRYASSRGDDHPSQDGNLKATEEFVPLLNVFVNRWLSGRPASSGPAPAETAEVVAAQATEAVAVEATEAVAVEATEAVAVEATDIPVAQQPADTPAAEESSEGEQRGLCPGAGVILIGAVTAGTALGRRRRQGGRG